MKKSILFITAAFFFFGTVQAFSLNESQVLRDLHSNNYRVANNAILKVKYKKLKYANNINRAHAILRSLISNQRKPANIRMAAGRAVAYLKMYSAKYTLRSAIQRERNYQVKSSFQRSLRQLEGNKGSYRGSKTHKGTRSYHGTPKYSGTPKYKGSLRYSGTRGHGGTPR